MKKRGLFLINLGTPRSPSRGDVALYLREFLMDPLVIDLPYLARFLLVYGAILPFRPQKSAAAYKKIWTPRGSPLLFHTEDLKEKVQNELGPTYQVEIGMRYGEPGLKKALMLFKNMEARGELESLQIYPLYPQYSLAATESCVLLAKKWIQALDFKSPISFLPPFYKRPEFIRAFAEQGRKILSQDTFDFMLFSFHGLPEHQVQRCDLSQKHCLQSAHCCDVISEVNQNCYRAQSFDTAKNIAAELGFKPEAYAVSFQSRLGRRPWIKPYTDLLLKELAERGIKRLLVFCPAFVADCLETLEEIEIRASEDFKSFGGEKLTLVPSLNSSELWVKALAAWAREK